MSGAYASRDTAALAARMGFFARRLSSATAKADYSGRVAANPNTALNSVGNIVETATPQTPDADGEPVPGLSNNGGCFGFDRGNIVFTPTTEVSAGFEYYLKYTTDHVIQSRQRLKGFDSVYLGTGADMRFSLANRYEDRRGGIAQNRSYTAIVFDHAEGRQYRLSYTRNGTADTLWSEFAARTAQVVTPAAGSVANPVLQVRSGTRWEPYAGDWALYDGYIAERGETTVELRVRTAAERLSPSSPKYFNRIYFHGAEEGMSLTLHKECSLQPRFSSAPGYGSAITFADVARHRIRQSEPARSAAAPLQPALPHRTGDKNRPDRTGGRFLRRRPRGRLAGENRLLAVRGAGGHRPRSPRTPHMALSGGRRSRGPFRRRG